ncbi:MAG: glycerophosphoryl diester phosphodiesterase [Acidobacteriota bacterium]|jgi:glycerophosphoryl diester phosphodiesterase|nr:glycerophosphoryl diester phosphodiesterase [Acidobacteriota bacterium]
MRSKEKFAVSSSQSAEDVRPALLPTANCKPPAAPLIIGHRGAAAVAPENTLLSFKRAISDGADGIEFDVRLARDSVPVVIHDSTLRRTARRDGRVGDSSSSVLAGTDVGTWFNLRFPRLARAEYASATVPTLADVFKLFAGTDVRLYVELKCEARDRAPLVAAVSKLIRSHSAMDQVVVESFDLAAITEIRRIEPMIRTAALFDRKLSRPIRSIRSMITRALRAGASEVALHRTLASAAAVEAAMRQNLRTVVWTADSPAWVDRAIKRRIDAIITNNPEHLCARRAELLARG